MTQEEKAKAYELALEKAMKLYERGTITENLSYLFPELKESGDEVVRKTLIEFFEERNKTRITWCGVYVQKILAWLEKQGKKDVRNENLEQLLAADNIFQMAMNDDMVQEAKTKAINALSELNIGKLLGIETQGENLNMAKSPQLGEQKQEKNKGNIGGVSSNWSEEDEDMLNDAIGAIGAADFYTDDGKQELENWLKSLKQRI